MGAVIVSKSEFYAQRGDSILEVILAMAVVAMVTPFIYSQIISANDTVVDSAVVGKITDVRNSVLNFVRMNQDTWPDVAQIRMADGELDAISDMPSAGFIDKYIVRGAAVSDIYLAFDLGYDALRTNRIARAIGADAAVVAHDGIAYGDAWAVAAPDFKPGDLIYRISRTTSGQDMSKYLHRGGADGLNTMMRDLSMGNNNIYDIGTVIGKSASSDNISTTFLESELLSADNVYFSSGANLSGEATRFGSLRVTGDVSGFRNILADKINGSGHGTSGNIITDKAIVTNSLTVGTNLNLKSESARTISAFTAISAGSVSTTFVYTDQIMFMENFGLTISGELLASTTAPLKIGGWSFPSNSAPKFSEFKLTRATIPTTPTDTEFGAIIDAAWRGAAVVNPMEITIK